eukprot:TRINITY_DN1190_c0_g1_i2.p1 TRINITY_DN1190_c0_g1~~TRINITY_DN1190_c0_g1_i2.p1  ORF type:complete len:364 (-),score=84.48 TRINITY_DN1190_c0_g1_i2:186-1277(-)
MARVLAVNHGFDSMVLWSQDENGLLIQMQTRTSLGLKSSKMLMHYYFLRFRAPDDDKMRFFDNYLNSGKPIIGCRTATHSFNFDQAGRTDSIFRDFYQFDNDGGFGRHVMGETYSGQIGDNGGQGQHGVIAEGQENNPIVNGIDNDPTSPDSLHGDSNLYLVSEFFAGTESTTIITGHLLNSLDELAGDDDTVATEPVAWTRTFVGPTPTSLTPQESKETHVFTTTMGAANDDQFVGMRRLLVNAVYVLLEMDVPDKADVGLTFEYNPSDSGIGASFVQGKFTPDDFADPTAPIPPQEKDAEAEFTALIERDPWILVLMLVATIGLAVIIGYACRRYRKYMDPETGMLEDTEADIKYAEMVAF